MQPGDVIFLDRDGVINRDSPDYIKSWAEFEFLPGSLEALSLLTQGGYRLIMITNQSIINRGMVPMEVLSQIHDRLRQSVAAAGGHIEDIFFCPHRPDENCVCRKPRPGLIRQAVQRYGIDPTASMMIGDNAKDILCGRNAECGSTMLVQTGNGRTAEQILKEKQIIPDYVVSDLLHGAQLILSQTAVPGRS